MEKLYKVQMNSKGAPDFSTAVEVADRPQGEWIPCSKRLPNEDGFYLVTITDGEQVAVCKMPFVESEWKGNWSDDEVLAWMPLLKPWKGADDYERAIEQMEHDMLYEPTYNPEDGSM